MMKTSGNILFCATVAILFLATLFMAMVPAARAEDVDRPQAAPPSTEPDPGTPWLKAVSSANTITMGQTAVITLSGGQLDVGEADFLEEYGSEFAAIVKVVQLDDTHFKIKGMGPGNAVLKFSDGKNEASVKIRVTAK